MITLIKEIKQRYPDAKLIFNRGFEILPELHQDVYAVAVESLYQAWYEDKKEYGLVPEAERQHLLPLLASIHKDYQLPIIVMDYVKPGNTQLAR